MGHLKLEQGDKVEKGRENGNEISEHMEKLNVEAQGNRAILDQVEAVDDDDVLIIESAMQRSGDIAKEKAESEGTVPANEVGEGLEDTAVESDEYADREGTAADTVGGMNADYVSVGAKAEQDFSASEEEFRRNAEAARATAAEVRTTVSEKSQRLENTF